MAFRAGIIVTSPDSSEIILIVETQLAIKNLQETESQLKRYMLHVGCPVGLVVTPDKLRIYKDQYLSSSLDSVRRVAEFDISKVLNFRSQDPQIEEREFLLEQRVQEWLEKLPANLDLPQYEPSLKDALRWHVLPAIFEGTIQAGGLRYTSRTT